MSNPQYIRLTTTHVSLQTTHSSARSQRAFHQGDPVAALVNLPKLFGCSQDGRAMFGDADQHFFCVELFEDVIAAIELAHKNGWIIADPNRREVAVASGVGGGAAKYGPGLEWRISLAERDGYYRRPETPAPSPAEVAAKHEAWAKAEMEKARDEAKAALDDAREAASMTEEAAEAANAYPFQPIYLTADSDCVYEGDTSLGPVEFVLPAAGKIKGFTFKKLDGDHPLIINLTPPAEIAAKHEAWAKAQMEKARDEAKTAASAAERAASMTKEEIAIARTAAGIQSAIDMGAASDERMETTAQKIASDISEAAWDGASPREPKHGDLRTVQHGDCWIVEMRCVYPSGIGYTKGWSWSAMAVPPELFPHGGYANRQTAEAAIRAAGYGDRLAEL